VPMKPQANRAEHQSGDRQESYFLPEDYYTIYNHAGELQVGDEVVFLHHDVEYLVPAQNAGLLDEVKAKIASGDSHPSVEGVESIRIKEQLLTPVGRGDSQGRYGNQSLQREFSRGGHTYKFVFECAVYRGMVHFVVSLRNKFEYRCGRKDWCNAGETVNKTISGELAYMRNPNRPLTFVQNGENNGNKLLNSIARTTNDCVDLSNVRASFYAYAPFAGEYFVENNVVFNTEADCL